MPRSLDGKLAAFVRELPSIHVKQDLAELARRVAYGDVGILRGVRERLAAHHDGTEREEVAIRQIPPPGDAAEVQRDALVVTWFGGLTSDARAATVDRLSAGGAENASASRALLRGPQAILQLTQAERDALTKGSLEQHQRDSLITLSRQRTSIRRLEELLELAEAGLAPVKVDA